MTDFGLLDTGKRAHTKIAAYPPSPCSVAQLVPFAARYRIEAPLGHGTASVFRAKDLKTGIRHAVKRLPQDAALEPGEHEQFVSQVTLLSQLSHPNIVAMKELHRDEYGRSCLVMEHLDGMDALTHLIGGQRLTLSRVLEITRQVTSALHSAHLSGINHRGFELSSIFLALQRGLSGTVEEVVKVVGFGGVKLRTQPGQHVMRGIPGTAEYLAPEAIAGQRSELDASSDQWSVAVTVYRMLSGRLPFQAGDEASLRNQICNLPPAPLKELCPELPPHVVETIERALSKDKAQRFPSMAEFMRALSGQLPPRVAGAGLAVALPMPTTTPLAEARPSWASVPSRKRQEPADSSRRRRPISVSEVPTISMTVDPARTQNIDPAMLDQLRAQSQQPERPSLNPNQPQHLVPVSPDGAVPRPTAAPPPILPGGWLMARHGRRAQQRHTLVLVLGSCIGLGLGMSAAWLLGLRPSVHQQKKTLPVAASGDRLRQPPVAASTTERRVSGLASFDAVAECSLAMRHGDGSHSAFRRPDFSPPCPGLSNLLGTDSTMR